MILFRSRYRPVTVFGPPLPTVTVFRPTLSYRYRPLLTVTHRYEHFL
jgi:hypothetical protein